MSNLTVNTWPSIFPYDGWLEMRVSYNDDWVETRLTPDWNDCEYLYAVEVCAEVLRKRAAEKHRAAEWSDWERYKDRW